MIFLKTKTHSLQCNKIQKTFLFSRVLMRKIMALFVNHTIWIFVNTHICSDIHK